MTKKRKQKFLPGDFVRARGELCIVYGSYADQYGMGSTREYTLLTRARGRCSWYTEKEIELIEGGRLDLMLSFMGVERK